MKPPDQNTATMDELKAWRNRCRQQVAACERRPSARVATWSWWVQRLQAADLALRVATEEWEREGETMPVTSLRSNW